MWEANCWICGHEQQAERFDDWACSECGARHEYDEGHSLSFEEVQKLKASWPRPIPVSERLPDVTGFYLVYAPRKFWFTSVWQHASYASTRDGKRFVWIGDADSDELQVSYWMPMPPLPTSPPATE